MAEYIYLLSKDAIIIKPPKKSSMLLRMVVLMFAMAFGVYICTICLHQITTRSKVRIQDIQVIERPSAGGDDHDLFQVPKLHYPNPESFSREECVDNPVRYFAIVSTQRSGSGWFETLLNSHANVSSNGEIFSVLDRRRNVSAIVRTLDKVYNLDWFSSASKNECSGAVGFKWMLNQGLMEHHEEITEYLNRRGVSLVFMFRRNLLRRMVSLLANSDDKYAKLLNGTHKSHVHTTEEAEMLSKYKPKVNSTLLVSDLRKADDMITTALKNYNATRHIVVYYEDLVKDSKKLEEVQEFLRLPVLKLRSRQVKIHKGPLSELIENWEDVNKTLNGTEYEDFLRADY